MLKIFWRTFGLPLPLISHKREISWPCLAKCIVSQIYRTPESLNAATPNANLLNLCILPTLASDATFQINNAKFYVPVVTLSIENNIKFLENLKQGLNISPE